MKIQTNTTIAHTEQTSKQESTSIHHAQDRKSKLISAAESTITEKTGHTAKSLTDDQKPQLRKPSTNVQPGDIQQQLAALTGESPGDIKQ